MKTLLSLLDCYSATKIDGIYGRDLLGVGGITWSKWKNNKRDMPVKYYKKICNELSMPLTDNNKEICMKLVEVIYE